MFKKGLLFFSLVFSIIFNLFVHFPCDPFPDPVLPFRIFDCCFYVLTLSCSLSLFLSMEGGTKGGAIQGTYGGHKPCKILACQN